MNFTPQQQHSLLSKMGYNGPVDSSQMENFIASNPGAAAKMGKFQRVLTKGFQTGGLVHTNDDKNTTNKAMGDYVAKFGLPTNQAQRDAMQQWVTTGGETPTTPQTPNQVIIQPVPPTLPQPPNEVIGRPVPPTLPQPPAPEPAPVSPIQQGSLVSGTVAESPVAAQKAKYSEAMGKLAKAEQEAAGWSIEVKEFKNAQGKTVYQPLLSNSVADRQSITAGQANTEAEAKKLGEEKLVELQTKEVEEPQQEFIKAQQDLGIAQAKQAATTPSTREVTSGILQDPTSMLTQMQPAQMVATPEQALQQGTGEVTGPTPQGQVSTAGPAVTAETPTATPAATVEAAKVTPQVTEELTGLQPAQGEVSSDAQVVAAQGELSKGALADVVKFDREFLDRVEASDLEVTPEQLITAQGQDAIAPAAKIAQSTGIDPVVAEQGTVSVNELPDPAQIKESEMAQAEVVFSGGKLSEDATAVAAKLESFNVDNGTLAEAVQGDVNAQDTVQGQLANLMRQFDDGTPAWAAGAMRAANAAMASRGLGGSSMAGTAIVQAAMESAIPIAAQDAQTFAQMNLSNLDRRQQVALANAAAQQGLSLQNLSNEQQAALQNSANAFQLQAQDLTNMQQTMIANAQIKASLQGQNLSNRQQTNLVVAARYAEVANMNLNNRQQTALVKNSDNLTIEMSNLSNKQQSYISNAQLEAALQNQQIDNQQQTAIQNAARFSEAANITFNAKQQAQLHNSELMKTIGLAELNSEQAATLQNAATVAGMDMANLNNRQQAAVQNAQSFLQMDMANLNNEQQTSIFKTQQRVNALLSDQAAENAAEQFNAASENQTNQFFADLASTTSRFNADQKNAIAQFNSGQENAMEQFNTSVEEQREQFNSNNRLVVAQANAKWRQDIATINTAAENEALATAAKTANAYTNTALDEIWQRERDLMNFSFTQSENKLDRVLSILLGDKELEALNNKIRAENDRMAGAGLAAIGSTIVEGIFDFF